MLPERSSRSYMGLEPPSACLLTAADSLLSLFPMTESPSEKCEKKQGAVDCAVVDRPPSPSTLLSQLRHETKERTKAALPQLVQSQKRLCLGMMATRFMSFIEQTKVRRTSEGVTDDVRSQSRRVGLWEGASKERYHRWAFCTFRIHSIL